MDEADFLSTLRPSRIRDVQAGAPGWADVEVIDIESRDGGAVSAALERFGLRVRRTHVGQARHLVRALSEPSAEFVVLLCHGDEGSILLPELADEVQRYQPFAGHVTPERLRSFARFDGQVVVATGCDTGAAALAEAVLACGASAYVAPDGAPFGYASFFAPVAVFYELTEGRSLDEAVERLGARDAESAMWRVFRP